MLIRIRETTRNVNGRQVDATPPRVEIATGPLRLTIERGQVYEVTSVEGRVAMLTGNVEIAPPAPGQSLRSDAEIEAERAAAQAAAAPPAQAPAERLQAGEQQAEQNWTPSAAEAVSAPAQVTAAPTQQPAPHTTATTGEVTQ